MFIKGSEDKTMFDFLKIEHKHKHDFNASLGNFYVLWRSEYKNNFDEVKIFTRKKCSCGCCEDFLVGNKTFLPSMYYDASEEKEFIAAIKKQGILEEFEINIKANTAI